MLKNVHRWLICWEQESRHKFNYSQHLPPCNNATPSIILLCLRSNNNTWKTIKKVQTLNLLTTVPLYATIYVHGSATICHVVSTLQCHDLLNESSLWTSLASELLILLEVEETFPLYYQHSDMLSILES